MSAPPPIPRSSSVPLHPKPNFSPSRVSRVAKAAEEIYIEMAPLLNQMERYGQLVGELTEKYKLLGEGLLTSQNEVRSLQEECKALQEEAEKYKTLASGTSGMVGGFALGVGVGLTAMNLLLSGGVGCVTAIVARKVYKKIVGD